MWACFLFPFQNEYDQNAGTCWSRLFLAHFTTLFRMVTKSSVKQILFPWLVQGKILDTWTAFCSLSCMTKPLPNVGVLLTCFSQIHKFQIHKLVSWCDHLNISTMYSVFWLKRILNIIIQASIFREYRNKCFWRPKCFGKGTTSDYAVADIKWEGRSSDYVVLEIKREIPFSPLVLHA